MMTKIAVHPAPIGRDRADFMIRAPLDDGGWEQIWSRKLTESTFEICCIPFFASDLALGDVVRAAPLRESQYAIAEVLERSGHYTFRAWFGDSTRPKEARADLMDFVTGSGCAFEVSSDNLLAIDAPPGKEQVVADELARREAAGDLVYETGRI